MTAALSRAGGSKPLDDYLRRQASQDARLEHRRVRADRSRREPRRLLHAVVDVGRPCGPARQDKPQAAPLPDRAGDFARQACGRPAIIAAKAMAVSCSPMPCCARSSEIARSIIVDAKNQEARSFHERESILPLPRPAVSFVSPDGRYCQAVRVSASLPSEMSLPIAVRLFRSHSRGTNLDPIVRRVQLRRLARAGQSLLRPLRELRRGNPSRSWRSGG